MKIVSTQSLFEGNWLRLKRLHCLNQHGHPYEWEVVERKNCRHIVSILATLTPSMRIILIRQYRAPLNRAVISLPAGLVDIADDLESTAKKELLQETGYRGTISRISPGLALSAAMTSEILHLVTMSVDEHAEENKNPCQDLEPEEAIEVLLMDKATITDNLQSLNRQGDIISAGVWYLFGNNPMNL